MQSLYQNFAHACTGTKALIGKNNCFYVIAQPSKLYLYEKNKLTKTLKQTKKLVKHAMFVVVIIQPSNNWLKLSFFIMIKYLNISDKIKLISRD